MKYTKELLEKIVFSCLTMSEVARKVGIKPHGGGQTHLKKQILKFGIDISHFKGQGYNSKRKNYGKKPKEKILIKLPKNSNRAKTYQLKRALLESGVPYKCNSCEITKWNNKDIVLEIDHIDGNYLNNCKENLRFLCPNCHSQTNTYKIKNKNKESSVKVTK